MRALLVQYDIAWEDKPRNHRHIRELLDTVPPHNDDLILLPEMFDTGFSINVDITTSDAKASEEFLCSLAHDRCATVAGSISVMGPDGLARNRFMAFDSTGSQIAQYDKVHPFSFGRESERFASGDTLNTFHLGAATIFPTICYDLRFPELYRAGVDRGAEVLAIVANWPAARQSHWRALCIARAIENQAWVLALNRVGRDPHLDYDGGSLIIDPKGTIVIEGSESREEVLVASVDPEAAQRWRKKFPALADRKSGEFWRQGLEARFPG